MWKQWVFIFLMMTVAQPAWGQVTKHPLDIKLEACLKQNPGTTSERYCMNESNTQWEKQLNRIYTALGGNKNKPLLNAQLAWLKFRDAEYRYIDKRFGYDGTMYLLMIADAKLQIVRRRTLDLEDHLAFQKDHQ